MSNESIRAEFDHNCGMTLRDYFAAKAMAIVGDGEILVSAVKKELGMPEDAPYDYVIHWPQYVALKAYQMADAMLKQREL